MKNFPYLHNGWLKKKECCKLMLFNNKCKKNNKENCLSPSVSLLINHLGNQYCRQVRLYNCLTMIYTLYKLLNSSILMNQWTAPNSRQSQSFTLLKNSLQWIMDSSKFGEVHDVAEFPFLNNGQVQRQNRPSRSFCLKIPSNEWWTVP